MALIQDLFGILPIVNVGSLCYAVCLARLTSLEKRFCKFLTSIGQVGSDSYQGAGAPTMFQAIRRIVGSLSHEHVSENAYERAIRQSFLGNLLG